MLQTNRLEFRADAGAGRHPAARALASLQAEHAAREDSEGWETSAAPLVQPFHDVSDAHSDLVRMGARMTRRNGAWSICGSHCQAIRQFVQDVRVLELETLLSLSSHLGSSGRSWDEGLQPHLLIRRCLDGSDIPLTPRESLSSKGEPIFPFLHSVGDGDFDRFAVLLKILRRRGGHRFRPLPDRLSHHPKKRKSV